MWRRFVAMALAQLMEYRANFLLSVFESTAELVLLVVAYLVFYQFADDVAGWTREQALLLLGVYWLFDAVWSFQFARGLAGLSGLIRTGDLDFVLLRPVAAQFLVVCWRILDVKQVTKVVQCLLLILYAAHQAGVVWSAERVGVAFLFACCGFALLYAVRLAIAVCSFWVLQTDALYELYYALFDAARFPVAYFREPVRGLLTYVVPVAFATTFPTQALLGTADYRLLPAGVALAAAALFAVNRLWRSALRSYSSASS
jgi:ABC-2 type transport system permease protein